jgi:hypothetical protein
MQTGKALIGLLIGAAVSFAFYFFALLFLLHAKMPLLAILPLITAVIGGIYLFVVLMNGGYQAGFLSTLGVILDLTWSLLNTFAGLAIWLPLSLLKNGHIIVSSDTQRSCTINVDQNPRGPGWDTTIGTIIAGNWSAHEETHVWEARMFGPLYLPSYGLALLLNPLFRVIIGKATDAWVEGYHRIPWEDWAYMGGSSSSADVHWAGWFFGLLLSCIYLGCLLLVVFGIFVLGHALFWIAGIAGIFLYSLIRALLPHPAPI